MQTVIQTTGLTKQFGHCTAVNRIDLNIEGGQIFGLLGPNAAGKSTTIRLLIGLLSPDEGSTRILDMDLATQINEIKKRIGYVAQHFALYPELSVSENISFYTGLYRRIAKDKLQELLEKYNLLQFANQRAGTLSGGYKRRLSIACAIAHDPDLVFLDEPTAGIDPVTRKELWEQFYELAVAGKTLFITTHYMEEAERCHQLAFIHQGKLVADNTPKQIKKSFQTHKVYACQINYNPALAHTLKSMQGILVLNQLGENLRIVTDHTVNINALKSGIQQQTGSDIVLQEVPASIEDVFMTLTREKPSS